MINLLINFKIGTKFISIRTAYFTHAVSYLTLNGDKNL